MRLIDADDLWKCETCFHMQNGRCYDYCDHGESYRPAYSKLKIVDAAPVVHGHWEHDGTGANFCSACGEYPYDDGEYHLVWHTNYCPHCGAKMDEVIE